MEYNHLPRHSKNWLSLLPIILLSFRIEVSAACSVDRVMWYEGPNGYSSVRFETGWHILGTLARRIY